MRNDKILAIELRKQGNSYNQISAALKIPKSTLSEWFSKENWSQQLRTKLDPASKANFIAHSALMHSARAKILNDYYQSIKAGAAKQYFDYRSDPLFAAGLMLYLGEGSKCYKNQVGIANSDPNVLKIFLRFLRKFTDIEPQKIKFWVLIYPDLDKIRCQNYWLTELGLSEKSLYKTQTIKGRELTKKLHYGVGNIRISSTRLKVLIDKWISLLVTELCS